MDIETAIEWQKAFKKTYNGMPQEVDEVCDFMISALEELQQYRQIGTVDECRAVIEKQIPKEPLKRDVGGEKLRREFLSCPICGKRLLDIAYLNGKKDHITGKKSKICPDCGQALKWED